MDRRNIYKIDFGPGIEKEEFRSKGDKKKGSKLSKLFPFQQTYV